MAEIKQPTYQISYYDNGSWVPYQSAKVTADTAAGLEFEFSPRSAPNTRLVAKGIQVDFTRLGVRNRHQDEKALYYVRDGISGPKVFSVVKTEEIQPTEEKTETTSKAGWVLAALAIAGAWMALS